MWRERDSREEDLRVALCYVRLCVCSCRARTAPGEAGVGEGPLKCFCCVRVERRILRWPPPIEPLDQFRRGEVGPIVKRAVARPRQERELGRASLLRQRLEELADDTNKRRHIVLWAPPYSYGYTRIDLRHERLWPRPWIAREDIDKRIERAVILRAAS